MEPRDRRIAIFLAVAGLGASLTGLLGFLINVVNNTLPWHPEQGIREHYLAVGESYSQGFFVGFFVCFFMTLIVLAIWNGATARRDRRAPERSTTR